MSSINHQYHKYSHIYSFYGVFRTFLYKNGHILAFFDDFSKYQAQKVDIIGVSYDDVESHKDFSDTYSMPFTLLADVDHKLAKAMDVDRILPWPHASRQTFLVNPQGKIVKHYSSVDPDTHSSSLLKDLKGFNSK